MKKLWTLFCAFLKIGAFTFGGGYAMIVLLENEFIAKKQWISKEEFLDMVALAESTPGPVAINSATYLGYRMAGIAGAGIATIAVCIPSFLIIYVISLFLEGFLSLTVVSHAFQGIQVCVVYLILSAGIKMLKEVEKTIWNMLIIIGVMTAMMVCSLLAVSFSSIYYILICGVIGIVIHMLNKMKTHGGNRA